MVKNFVNGYALQIVNDPIRNYRRLEFCNNHFIKNVYIV